MSLFNSKIAKAIVQLMAVVGPAIAAAPAVAQLSQPLGAQVEADRAAAQSQERINEIRERTQDAASRYAQALADSESLEQYNEQLNAQVMSQEEEIASIERQLLEIETTNREVQPLMQEMVATLEQFVALDVPFLLEERTRRVENLKNIMGRADVTISEKYRGILEAYQIELEYGRTLDAYEGRLGNGPDARTVEFVRLGRISLMYQTLDGSETGYWDAQQRQWVVDNSYAEAVEEAIRVARQDGAPVLLTVPVPAPQEVRS
jgi:hypothetical protein